MDLLRFPVDNECKEEEDLMSSVVDSAAAPVSDEGVSRPPSREHIVQLLKSMHHEQLIELLVPYIQDDHGTYSRLLRETESDVHRRKLFVHGLPAKTTEEQFRKFFEQYGEVELVELPHAKAHSEVKFGFVVFSGVQSLHMALEHPTKQFEGKEICCKVFTVRSSSVDSSPQTVSNAALLNSHRKVFVSGLGPFITERDLYEHFKICGDVEVAQVSPGKSTGYVLFSEAAHARESILKLNKSMLAGRQITVAWYRKQEEMRRPSLSNAPVIPRGNPAAFSSPPLNSASFAQSSTGWYNYHPYVQQDPFVLVPMPVYQQEYQIEPFFSVLEDHDSKPFQ